MKVFADNFFSSIPLAVALREKGIFMVGTIRQNRMGGCQLESEKELKARGRGAFDAMTEMKTGTNLVRWMDKKAINFISTYCAVEPQGTALRWNSAEKKKTPIPRPDIVAEYNAFMGGVDLADMLIELYRVDRKSRKWYTRIVYWVLGVAVVNAWLLTRKFNKMSLADFQSDVAHGLLRANKPASGSSSKRGRPPKNRDATPAGPSAKRILLVDDVRFDCRDHWPEFKSVRKCKLCKAKTNVECTKCTLGLCLTRNRNCFKIFHNK